MRGRRAAGLWLTSGPSCADRTWSYNRYLIVTNMKKRYCTAGWSIFTLVPTVLAANMPKIAATAYCRSRKADQNVQNPCCYRSEWSPCMSVSAGGALPPPMLSSPPDQKTSSSSPMETMHHFTEFCKAFCDFGADVLRFIQILGKKEDIYLPCNVLSVERYLCPRPSQGQQQ